MAKSISVRNPDIRVENSTPSQRKSAYSVRWSAPILAQHGASRIADFGCGALRNLRVQENRFEEITLVETASRCLVLEPKVRGKNHLRLQSTQVFEEDVSTYDAIFFISIFHTIPDPAYRMRLVEIAITKLRPGGFIVVDVPQSETYYNRRRCHLPKHKDGYLLRWGSHYSFYKSFYARELDSMFLRVAGVSLFKKTHYCKHLIRIWQKHTHEGER